MEETKSREIEIDLQDLWIVFKNCWIWALAALIVVFAGIYTVMTVVHVPEYTATAKIYVLNIKTEGTTGSNNITTSDISIANYLINDCQELLMSEDNILSPVITELGLQNQLTPKQLKSMISHSTSSVSDRTLLLSVTSTDKEESQQIANALAYHMADYFNNELYSQELLNVTDTAKLPETESNAVSPLMIALISFVCALLVYAVFFIIYIMDDKINTAEDVENYLGVSTLGSIPNEHEVKRRKNKNGYYYSQYGHNANPAAQKLASQKQAQSAPARPATAAPQAAKAAPATPTARPAASSPASSARSSAQAPSVKQTPSATAARPVNVARPASITRPANTTRPASATRPTNAAPVARPMAPATPAKAPVERPTSSTATAAPTAREQAPNNQTEE